MDTITFRCTACKFQLRVGADKVGRKAKCSKCGTLLTIPAANDAAPPPAPVPAAAAPPAKAEEEEEKAYGMKELPDLAQERTKTEAEQPAKVLKGPGRIKVKKQAKITNPDEWRKVAFGCQIIAAGLCLWLAAYFFNRLPLIVGMTDGEEYATVADERLGTSTGTAPDFCAYAIGVLSGHEWYGTMIWVARLSQVLFVLTYGPLLVGYVICMAVPNSLGTQLQLKVLILLALLNAIVIVFFRVLPMFGAYQYCILPLVAPEVVMVDMNVERAETLGTFWLKFPLGESYLAILLTILWYLEPAMIATFVVTVGKAIRSEEIEGRGSVAQKLAFSQIFIQTAWLMISMCGTSIVLLWSLRLVYTIGVAFFLGQMTYTIMVLLSMPAAVEEQLGDEGAAPAGGAAEPDEDDEDEDEEEDD